MIELAPMTIADCAAALQLWSSTDGIAVMPDVDTPEQLARLLERNPGCCFVARADGQLIGTSLGGHDARRGFLYHVAVAPEFRCRGIGTRLVESTLAGMRAAGITRVHLFVMKGNEQGKSFWHGLGFHERSELTPMSVNLAK